MCSTKLRSERWEKAQRGVSRLLGRWQMLTLTVRHHEGMALAWLLVGLLRAWAATKRGGKVQRLWTEHVTASLRALEVTHGESGFHPHIHVFLRTDEWTLEETEALFSRWQACVDKHLGPACVPDAAHGLRWSNPVEFGCPTDCALDHEHRAGVVTEEDRVAYLFKLGQELTGSTKVAGRDRDVANRTPWELASDAVEGDERSAALWQEFRRATKGKRMIELDDRLARAAKEQALAILGVEYTSEELAPREQSITIALSTAELCALRMFERWHDDAIVGRIMTDVAISSDPRQTVDVWLDLVCARVRVTRYPPAREIEPEDVPFLDTG